MNNPVSKSRLKEMYDDLRQQWPTIKLHLKSCKQDTETVRALILVYYHLMKRYSLSVMLYISFIYFCKFKKKIDKISGCKTGDGENERGYKQQTWIQGAQQWTDISEGIEYFRVILGHYSSVAIIIVVFLL